MTTDDASKLIREAAARFADANIVWRRARIGLFGFWVGDDPLKEMETPLQRAQLSEDAWAQLHSDKKNPYTCLVEFMSLGGVVIRWEQYVLDIQLPSGERLGLPEVTFEQAKRTV
ncbi:hypothetical protein thsps21_36940 [Pseudomonas sp. No.21]|uniref:hypothetical protein n=1 Tax=Pseudomonas tohonis TaxID=2725477 RepID=UPI001F1A08F1|nr:hypothetical protein [Pseudomonas tohonis]GJN45625.1 hypothetical protein TUM20249_16110 [Pseudomonas tohonis]